MLERIPLAYYALAGLINFIASFILAIFVLYKSPKLRVNRIFFVFASVASCWGLFHFLWLHTVNNSSLADFYLRTVMLFVIFVPATFTHFILAFLKIDNNKKINAANYFISLILGVTVYTPLFAKDMGAFLVFPFWLKPGPVFHLHLIHFLGNIIYAHILMLRSLKRTSGIFRNQILYVFIGTGIGYAAGVLNYCPWYRIPIPPFLNPLVSIYVAFASYAIIKYRLLDINVALTRAGVFIAVYLLVLGIPFWIGFKYLGQGAWILPVSIMAVFASVGPFIYIFLQRRTEDALLKERRRYQETINNLSGTMIDIRDIDKLFATITSTITEAIKIKFTVIYLKQEEYKSFQLKSCYPKEIKSQFQELMPLTDPLVGILNQRKKPSLGEEIGEQKGINLDSGVIIPCFGKEGLIGFIVLGAKQNNQMYTNDDLLVFETFSYNTGSAIENCMYWKKLENQQRMYRIEEMHTFSYSLAHEIDNPMTIIIRGLEVLRRDYAEYIDKEPELKKFIELLDLMLEAAFRVSGMVKAVQEFGQRTSSEFTIVKLEKAIDTFLNLYLPHFKMNGIAFTKDIPETFPLIRGVSQEIEQTLIILAKNAVQALKDTKEKKVNLKAEVVNSGWIRITLTDNGPGIEKEKLLSIFTAFYTTKGTQDGTGMGLYNATQFIVERHKGKIWAESDGMGKGASFIIELPIAKDIKPEELKEEKKSNIIKLD